MRAGFQPRLCWGNRVLNCLAAGVPNLRFAPPLALAADTVIRTEADQFRSVANLHPTQLSSHIRKINVARVLIGGIDADIAAGFAGAVVVGNRAAASGWSE